MDTRESIRYWGGALAAAAVIGAILVAVVVVQMRPPRPKTAAQTQAATRTQATVKPQATIKPQAAAVAQATVKPQAMVKPQAAAVAQATVKPQPAVKPPATSKAPAAGTTLTEAERKMSEELWVEQKKLDTDSARVMAATPDGRRRVTEMIAKQLNVPDTLVTDLRGRKIGYGEITATLALSQQLVKRDKVTRQQAVDKVLGARKSGKGWAALARGLDLRLADVLSDVRKADKQVAKLVTLKAAR